MRSPGTTDYSKAMFTLNTVDMPLVPIRLAEVEKFYSFGQDVGEQPLVYQNGGSIGW